MSTEATGGQRGADGAVEPDAAAEGTEPAATAVAAPTAWDTAAPSAWGATAGTDAAEPAALVPDQAPAPDETAAAPGSDATADEAPSPAGAPQAEEALASSEAETAETGEVVLNAADPADEPDTGDEASESDEGLEGNRAGAPGENGELAGPEDPGADSDPDEVDYPDEAAEPDEADEADGYADDEAAADDEEHGQPGEPAADDEEYGEPGDADEADEATPPQRARRWPRVLLALGFVVLAAVIVGGAIAIVGSVTHGFKKPVKITYKESALFGLKTGQCFDPQGQSYSLVSCDSSHQAEVFATFVLSGTKYPGATAIAAQASDGCTSRLTGYVNPQLALSLTSTYVYPDSVAWQAGTRTVICEVRAASGTLTGSVRSATAS
jgi:Septum formation